MFTFVPCWHPGNRWETIYTTWWKTWNSGLREKIQIMARWRIWTRDLQMLTPAPLTSWPCRFIRPIYYLWGLTLVFSNSLLVVKRIAFLASLTFSSLWIDIHVSLSSFVVFQLMRILLIICFIFDQNQFSAGGKPMLTSIITTLVVSRPVGVMLIFLHYQFKEKLTLLYLLTVAWSCRAFTNLQNSCILKKNNCNKYTLLQLHVCETIFCRKYL